MRDPQSPEFAAPAAARTTAGRKAGTIVATGTVLVAITAFAITPDGWHRVIAGEILPLLTHPLIGPPLMVLLITAGSLLMAPMLAMIALAAMIFQPLPAFIVTFTGALCGASLLFWLGRRFGRDEVERRWGRRLAGANALIAANGSVAIAISRATPVLPFTVVSLAAGLSQLRFADYLAGTAAGMAPVIIAYGIVGRRLSELLTHPSFTDAAITFAVAASAAGIGWAGGRLMRRRKAVAQATGEVS